MVEMKFKANYLVFILFVLLMISLGSVAASENVASDDVDNNDLISLPLYSTLEIDDNVDMQNDVNEVSLETNNNKTHSLGDVLKVSHNSPLKAGPSGTFDDIQNAIENAKSGETVFLNGTNYSRLNKEITIDRDIVIDGASADGNGISILDAKSASRIFYSSGNHNITLKNLVFENPSLNIDGYCAYFAGGNLTIQNLTIRNIKGTSVISRVSILLGAIFLGSGSTLNASNLTFKNNTINYSFNYNSNSRNLDFNGILLWVGNSSNVELNNLNIYDNNISAYYPRTSNEKLGFVHIDRLSNVSMSDVNFKNNSINYSFRYVSNNVDGILLWVGNSSNVELNNLNIYDNNISSSKQFRGLVYTHTSNVNISDVNFCNNYLDVINARIYGGFFYGYKGYFNLSNLNFEDNGVVNYTEMYSFIRVESNSSIYLTNVHFYRNYFQGTRNVGTILSTGNSKALVNYCYIEDNCVNDTIDVGANQNQAGFLSIYGSGIVNQCHSLNNYVNDAYGGIVRLSTSTEHCYLENSTFVNTTLGAADISLDRFHHSDHGGVLCVDGPSGTNFGAVVRNCSFINNCNSLGGAITPHNHCIIVNCTFINNTATKYYGGAISTFYGNLSNMTTNREITVQDCYFEGNTAPLGGAIQANGDDVHIYGCTFVNNTACKGGAVFLFGNTIDLHNSTFTENVATDDIPEVLVGKFDWGLFNWNVEGGAVYIYGNSTVLYNNKFMYNEAAGKNSDGCGGAIYVYGNNATMNKNHFDDNFAHSGNGSAINIHGVDTTVKNSEFFYHSSKIGTVYIIGDRAHILNSIFEHNNASFGGGAVFIDGDYSLLTNDNFTDNNATIHGGAVHIRGDNATISNSTFLSNNAIPHPKDIEQGLGGAIFIRGNYNEIVKSLFDKNTARNGSAIYNRGKDVHINDDKFLENQAFSYLLNITATPKVSNHTGSNQVLINVVLVGGDNIINAIYNDGDPVDMFFHNVTYEHSTGNRTTTDKEIHPVDGAEQSQGGTLLYQDSREDYQNVTLSVVKEKNSNSGLLMAPAGITGDVILDGTYKTGLYGNISILMDNLDSGDYSVYSEHPEDRLYKQIDNSTTFKIIPQVDLEITKVVSNSTPNYKDEITWTITVINHGPSVAENVIVDDTLPNGLVYLYDDSEGKYDSAMGKWKIGNLAQSEEAILVITTLVNVTNTTITNTAVVKSDTYDKNDTNNEDNDTITVDPFADLAIEKTVSPHYPKKGAVVTWTITVTNNGPDTAVNALVRDVLPSGLEFIRSDGNYTNNIWYIGDMANGGTAVLNIETRILVTGAVITNIANVTSDTPDYDLTNNEDDATVDIGHEADLAIVKVVSNPTPKFGEVITWTITVTNNGPDRAIDVVVHDVLPSGLVYISDDSNGYYDNVSGIWTIGILQNSASVTLHILSQVNITNATITNVAVVDSDTHDPNETNNEDNDTITVDSFADLAIEKIVSPHYPKMNDVVTWTITVTNNGPDTAVNALVRDVLPSGLEFIESSGNYTNNVWYIGDMAKGDTAVLNITTRILVTDAVITNVANVSSDTPDLDLTNNVDNATLDIGHEADLSIVKSVSNSNPKFGDIITWTITVTNNGPDRAIDVVVHDKLPNGLIYIVDDSNGKYDDVSGVWTIETLQNKESITLNILSKVNITNATIMNVALVDSDTHDPNETNNKDNDTITVNPFADLAIEKTVSPHYPKKGDVVTWTITVTNNGPDTAVNAFVRDVLPSGLEFIESDGNYTNNIWYIGDMANGHIFILNIKTRILLTGAVITNVAEVTSDTPDYDLTNNVDNATVDSDHEADLAIVKVVSDSTPKVGDVITWTITVTNKGPERAVDVVVHDKLPDGLVYISDDSNGKYDDVSGVWTIGTLQNNTSVTLNILSLVNITNAIITNVALVDSDTHDPDETNNRANDTILIRPFADLSIEKTVSPHYPKMNDVVTWTITVTNNGPDMAVNAFVRDVLPSGLEFIESDGNYTNNVWYIGDIANGGTAVLNIKTRILVTDAVITNVANVTSDTHDYDLTNNVDNATVDIGHEADLAITKVVSNSTPKLDDIVTWTITVTNNGPDRAINVVVYDVLPKGLELIESDGVFSDNMWYIGNLANGDTAVLNIKTRVLLSNAVITNVANVTSDTYDINLTNNVGNDTIIVPPQADLSIVKDVNAVKASIYDMLVWTITLSNNGPDTAENIVVKEILPLGLKLLSAEADAGSYSDGIWRIDSLNNGDVVTLKLVTEVTILNGTITNIVNVESSTYDPNKDNNNAVAVVNIISNETESNETESNDTVIKESVSSSSPLALYPTANPFAIVILALLSIVFVRLRRIKL